MAEIDCRHFNGYKPCGKSDKCNRDCPSLSIPTSRLLIVHLEALGAVLRATSLLPSIRRRFPRAHITWVTKAPSHQLLVGNPLIDRVLTISGEDQLALSNLEFDAAFCIDKSLVASGVLKLVRVDKIYGFKADAITGSIIPANPEARTLWRLGLSNHEKFFVNTKPETQLMVEAFDLGTYQKDPYILNMSEEELQLTEERRVNWKRDKKILIGINTGCADTIAAKKLSIEKHCELIDQLNKMDGVAVVLLGGREDEERNKAISRATGVVNSPTNEGLRSGISSVSACDLVVTGDSLGMHMGIALQKWVVVWFGPTCSHEIELYDRGEKIASPVSCTPCWKRACDHKPMCYDLVSIDSILDGVKKGILWYQKKGSSSFRQRLLEMHSSPSL